MGILNWIFGAGVVATVIDPDIPAKVIETIPSAIEMVPEVIGSLPEAVPAVIETALDTALDLFDL